MTAVLKTNAAIVEINENTIEKRFAEFAAAALRERAGARLIGEHTFGDSTWLKLFLIRDGAAMTVSAGKVLTSRGFDYSGGGLKPDVPLATAGPNGADALVDRAVEELSKG